jgi:hypothetical protein
VSSEEVTPEEIELHAAMLTSLAQLVRAGHLTAQKAQVESFRFRICLMTDSEETVVRLLRKIYAIATEKWTMTGKFAHIADLASGALQELGQPDPRYEHLEPQLSQLVKEQAGLSGCPSAIQSSQVAGPE